jgi:group I intron endonuclease
MRGAGIYQIRNTLNGKVYIGSAENVYDRWAVHRSLLKHGNHHCPPLQADWIKYGKDAFIFEVIEEVAGVVSEEDLWPYEQVYLDQAFASGLQYNVYLSARSPLGVKRSAETCAKIGANFKDRKHTPEARAKISAANRGRKLPPRTAEHTAKQAAVQRGRHVVSAETSAKLSAVWKGRKHTAEAHKKIGVASAATWEGLSVEARAEMGAKISVAKRKLAIARMARPVVKPRWWNAMSEYRVHIAPRLISYGFFNSIQEEQL